MLALFWNCRGLGCLTVVQPLKMFLKSHNLNDLLILELHTASLPKIQKLFKALGFPNMEFFPAYGRSGGIILCWKDNVDAHIVVVNEFMISCLIFNDSPHKTWQLTGVYGPCQPPRKLEFWNQLLKIEEN